MSNGYYNPDEIQYAPEPEETNDTYVFDAGTEQTLALEPQRPAMPSINPIMFEAQKRVRKANYYEMFINDRLFESNDPISFEVEREIKGFVIEQYQKLLGILGPEKSPDKSLTEDEIVVLKEVVRTIKARPPRQVQQTPVQHAQQPAGNFYAPPAPQVVHPTVQPPPPPEQPRVRRRKATKQATPDQPRTTPSAAPRQGGKRQTELANGQVAPDLTGLDIRAHPPMTKDMQEMGMARHANPQVTAGKPISSSDGNRGQ